MEKQTDNLLQDTLNEAALKYVSAQQLVVPRNPPGSGAVNLLTEGNVLRNANVYVVGTGYFPFMEPIRIEDDPHAWLVDQVRLLHLRQVDLVDWDEIAEELEAMANTDRSTVISHLRNILANFLKLAYSAIRRSEKSWKGSVLRARLDLSLMVDNSKSLRNDLPEFVVTAYKQARSLAANEMGLDKYQAQRLFPEECRWSIAEIRDEEFVPDIAPTANGRTR